jgi:hypothetical protein
MEYEGRMGVLCDQIHHAVDFLNLTMNRWWQAVAQLWMGEPCIPPNKARIWRLELWFLGHTPLCWVVLLFVAVLPWREPKAAMVKSPGNSFNKVCFLVFCYKKSSLNLPPPTRGGRLGSMADLLSLCGG